MKMCFDERLAHAVRHPTPVQTNKSVGEAEYIVIFPRFCRVMLWDEFMSRQSFARALMNMRGGIAA